MKRLTILIVALLQAALLLAQTPQEMQLLRNRLNCFAYAKKVKKVSDTECKIWLSSGDSMVLRSGKDKSKFAFKSLDIRKEVITAKPHKGKLIKIGRKPDQEGALMALFKATKGKSWNRNKGWGNFENGVRGWEGVTCNKWGYVTRIKLTDNNLQGKLPDVFYAFPKLRQILLNKNQLTGELPRSLAWLPNECRVNIQYNKFSQTTFYVPRERIQYPAKNIRCYPQQPEFYDFRLFVDCDVDLNPVNGHYPDNHCRLYHKAPEGAGVDIYVIGDGYDQAEHAVGGTADYWMERAADAVFDIEPYSKLKHLFNIYLVYGYSNERGTGLFNNSRDCRYKCWQKQPTKRSNTIFRAQTMFNVCNESVEKAGYTIKPGRMYVLTVLNSTNNGLYRGMMYSRRVKDGSEEGRKMSISINPTNPVGFNSLIWHEFGGHAFGGLLDEYTPRKGKEDKLFQKPEIKSANLDLESDPKRVKWAQFIADPRYAEEKIGVYKGGFNCSNVYRATETSIMRRGGNSKLRFNAPSRAEIYKRIMSKAFPGWKFDYEEFVKFDLGDKYYPLDNKNTNNQ